jgi:hypothetical protein
MKLEFNVLAMVLVQLEIATNRDRELRDETLRRVGRRASDELNI